MKRPLIYFLLALCVLFGTTSTKGCGGTETGNPAHEGQPLIPGSPLLQNPSLTLMDSLCNKLTTCLDEVNETSCRASVAQSPTLGQRFGADPNHYPTYLDLIVEIQLADVRTDQDELKACLESLDQLQCDDEHMRAIEVDINGTITNLDQLIPEQHCPQVFSEPEEA